MSSKFSKFTSKELTTRNKAIVREWKLNTPCRRCGNKTENAETYLKPGESSNRKFTRYYTWRVEILEEELSKREPFCKGCYMKWLHGDVIEEFESKPERPQRPAPESDDIITVSPANHRPPPKTRLGSSGRSKRVPKTLFEVFSDIERGLNDL